MRKHLLRKQTAAGILLASGFLIQGLAAAELKITATIFPLYEFASAVAGDRAEVHLLLPPGADIHVWRPKPGDLLNLSKSDLIVSVGRDLEPWVRDLTAGSIAKNLRVFEAARGLPLIRADHDHDDHGHDHDHGHGERYDPHVWLDLDLDVRIVEALARELSALSPADAGVFSSNAETYIRKLRNLDERYVEILASCRQRLLVVAGHAAFGYLARRYGMEQVSLYGLSPDAQATPKKMIEIVEFVRKRGVSAVFTETAVSGALAETLSRETGAKLLFLNPGAALTRNQISQGATFLTLMEDNLRTLADGLDCR
jgi:zinc transport system substrate-binding protein